MKASDSCKIQVLLFMIFYRPPSVMSHKYVTKVVWYILAQLSSINNTMSMVSGVSVQVSVRAALPPRSRRRTRTR